MSSLNSIRTHFPFLSRKIRGRSLVYLDNASTSQKPRSVISAISDFYTAHNANTHRGIHTLSEEATAIYENTRELVKNFLRAKHREEIIFTSGTTESLNLVAFGLTDRLKRGDEILLSEAEHHSNIVPWQVAARKRGLKIKYIPLRYSGRLREGNSGRLDLAAFHKLLTRKTKIVSITHASNVTGAVTPLAKFISAAHKAGAVVIVDAAQSAAHLSINVQKLECDFLTFSGHKIHGPTGIGVLYGKKTLLEKLHPRKFGGHMIEKVTKEKTTFTDLPARLEGGTMPLAEVAGLAAAIKFIRSLGWTTLKTHGRELCEYGLKRLLSVAGLRILGPTDAKDRLPIFSFTLDDIPAHDIATLLDQAGIAVRSGHHCAQILHRAFGIPATTRASCGLYNTKADIDKLAQRLLEIKKIFNPPSPKSERVG